MILVKLPDGSQASFPDGTPPETMKAAIQKKFPPTAGLPQGQSSPVIGSTPADIGYNAALQKTQRDFGMNPASSIALRQQNDPSLFNLARSGTTFGLSDELNGLSGGLAGMLQGQDFGQGYGDFSDLQNKTLALAREKNGMAGAAAELIPSLLTMGPEKAALDAIVAGTPKVAAALPSMLKTVGSSAATGGILGGIGGFTSTDGDVGERAQGAGKGALGGAVVGASAGALGRALGGMTSGGARFDGPATSDIKAQAKMLYDAARDSGVTMNQKGTIALSDQMHELAQNAGLISPTGRISSAYPRINEALKTFDDYANGEMTVPQMQAVRQTLEDAAGSLDKGERRIGMMMLKKFDGTVAQGVPQLADATPLYARAMRGQTIDKMIAKGERKGNYPAQFSALTEKIAANGPKGFSPDEVAAIEKAGNRGPASNTLRGVSSLARRTPYLNWALFPLDMAGKAGSNALDKRAAMLASALIRRGGKAVPSPSQAAIAQALINGGNLGAGFGGYQAGQLAGSGQ